MWRLGYVRVTNTITGEVSFQLDEQPFVDLVLPHGERVYGWVDSRAPWGDALLRWPDAPDVCSDPAGRLDHNQG